MMLFRLPMLLVLALFCSQFAIALHGPSHVDPHSNPHEQALLIADCDICAHGHGGDALPVQSFNINAPTGSPLPAALPNIAPAPSRIARALARAPPALI